MRVTEIAKMQKIDYKINLDIFKYADIIYSSHNKSIMNIPIPYLV